MDRRRGRAELAAPTPSPRPKRLGQRVVPSIADE